MKQDMKRWIAAAALGATIISSQALAQERGGWAQQDMTRQQAQQRADSLFERFDANHDGVVTKQEAQQVASRFGDRAQRIVDRLFGTDQSVTLQQFEAQSLARFDAADLNHDGVVTAVERQQATSAVSAQHAGESQPQ